MQAFETTQKVENGKVLIELPEEFNNHSVRIKVTEAKGLEDKEDWTNLPVEKKLEILKRFTGTAKYPNTDTNKYEVYDQ
jgi:hypothetical protein